MGYPWGQEPREIGNKFCIVAQLFPTEKAHRCRNHKGRGKELGVKGTGSGRFRPPCPPPQGSNYSFPLSVRT